MLWKSLCKLSGGLDFFLLYGSVVIIGVTCGGGAANAPPLPKLFFLSKDSFLLATELRGGEQIKMLE